MSNINEEFEKLLEDYLDFDSIQEKKECDEIKEEDVQHKCIHTFDDCDVISISSFVKEYLNIDTNASKLLHCGLKDLKCPYVVGVSNSYAIKNIELVKRGFLLVVSDYHHNNGTYLNPFYLKKILSMDVIRKRYKELLKVRTHDFKEFFDHYSKCVMLRSEIEVDEEFYTILKEQNKCKRIDLIRRYERVGK